MSRTENGASAGGVRSMTDAELDSVIGGHHSECRGVRRRSTYRIRHHEHGTRHRQTFAGWDTGRWLASVTFSDFQTDVPDLWPPPPRSPGAGLHVLVRNDGLPAVRDVHPLIRVGHLNHRLRSRTVWRGMRRDEGGGTNYYGCRKETEAM
jgi:hypothetical protein